MDHGNMDHSTSHRCSMNMLFTWDTQDLCIVFRQWHVSGTPSLIWSLMAIIALTAGYEAIREISRRYEAHSNVRRADDIPRRSARVVERKSKVIKAALYALQVFYSFFIMLLFMTYNGWIMLAVAAGAFLGYILFGNVSATKSVACH